MFKDEVHRMECKWRLYQWTARFVDCRNEKLTNWVSSFHPDRLTCRLAGPSCGDDYTGESNWVVRVIFSNDESWMIRFPRGGTVQVPDEKVECEVAVIQLIRQHTDIPMPNLKAWGLSRDNILGLGPFIMYEFVEGKDLGHILRHPDLEGRALADTVKDSTLEKLYRQIARFQLQLSSLNFSHIGGLSASSRFDAEQKVVVVDKRPLTWKGHTIMKLGAVDVLGSADSKFTNVTDYFDHIAQRNLIHLREQLSSAYDEDDARKKYRYWTATRELVSKMVLPEYNNGPFKLICDDFTLANMIVNNEEDLKIVAVIDWEWSYAGPTQLFWSPPRWLLMEQPDLWEADGDERLERYKHCMSLYLSILECEEEDFGDLVADLQSTPSVLMRQQWQDGKGWFHQVLLGSFHDPSDIPYRELRRIESAFDDLANAVPTSEVEQFAEMKMEHLRAYKVKLEEKKAEIRNRPVEW